MHLLLKLFIAIFLLSFKPIAYAQLPLPPGEHEALLDFYKNTKGDQWRYNYGWKEGKEGEECSWSGILCQNSRITSINLTFNNISGSIPESIGKLTNLQKLTINNNELTGPLPQSIKQLTKLDRLDLSYNKLEGSVSLESLQNLQYLDISYNQFSSIIFAQNNQLNTLKANHNKFTGPLFSGLVNLNNLTTLDLSYNEFTGSIPGLPATITGLYLHENLLEGVISENLMKLSNLKNLSISSNCLTTENTQLITFINEHDPYWLNGKNNTCYGKITKSQHEALLTLYENTGGDKWTKNSGWKDRIVGSECSWHGVTCIDDSGKLTRTNNGFLTRIELPSNNLKGTLSTNLANLSNLNTLDLSGNPGLSIPPDAIKGLAKLTILDLSNNQLTETIDAYFSKLNNILQDINLSSNTLSGNIGNIIKFTKLQKLNLSSNQLDGKLPNLGKDNLTNLEKIDLSNNHFSSSLPSSFGSLAQLNYFNFVNNDLDGSIPVSLKNLKNVRTGNGLINGNCFNSTNNTDLISFTNIIDPNWKNGQGNKKTCPPSTSVDIDSVPEDVSLNNRFTLEREALLSLYVNTNGASWTNQTNWNGKEGTECNWHGIHCSDDHVITAIELPSNNLKGPLPVGLGELSRLQTLNLSNNQLSGALPPTLTLLTDLTMLDLTNNQLQGLLPGTIGALTQLTTLYLDYNYFNGNVPAGLTALEKLQNFAVGDNCFSKPTSPELNTFLQSKEVNWLRYQNHCDTTTPAEPIAAPSAKLALGSFAEPNDQGSTATPLLVNDQPLYQLLSNNEEKDWYQFDAIQGKTYRLEIPTASVGVQINPTLRLYDANEQELSRTPKTMPAKGEAFNWTALATGPVKIQVVNNDGTGPEPLTAADAIVYQLKVSLDSGKNSVFTKGRIVNTCGQSLVQASVAATAASGSSVSAGQTVTNTFGEFGLQLAPGRYDLTITATGFSSTSQSIVVGNEPRTLAYPITLSPTTATACPSNPVPAQQAAAVYDTDKRLLTIKDILVGNQVFYAELQPINDKQLQLLRTYPLPGPLHSETETPVYDPVTLIAVLPKVTIDNHTWAIQLIPQGDGIFAINSSTQLDNTKTTSTP